MPTLAVENPLDENVLLYDGEELVGAKQNRILNVTVLVGGMGTVGLRAPPRWTRADCGRGGYPCAKDGERITD